MKGVMHDSVVTAIDIGTTKICVLIASVNRRTGLEIIGIGHHPSHGLQKGVVVNVAATVDSIKQAVEQARSMAGVDVSQAVVGISGGHIRSCNSTGVVAIKGREITQHDIDRVIDAAKAIPLPKDQYILHVLPQYFRVDGQETVLDSLGMYGVRLEAQVHIVTGAVSSAQNIMNACGQAGIQPQDIVLEQLASGDAVLTNAEREMGVGIIDIGGGTSDFAIYRSGKIRFSSVIPIAGNHFTNDIAVSLKIPFTQAEELKRTYGALLGVDRPLPYHTVQVPLGYQGGSRHVDLDLVREILQFRAEEIFELFSHEITTAHLYGLMPCGVVLTGGGALLEGIADLAAEKLGMPVRVGVPEQFGDQHGVTSMPDALKSPVYATAYGLLLHAAGGRNGAEHTGHNKPLLGGVLQRMKSWIYDFF